MMLSCGLQPFHISTTLYCEDIIFEIFAVFLKAAPFVTISGSPPLVLALFWSQWSFWIDITCNILFVFIFCYFDNGESLQNAQLPQTNENACWAKIVFFLSKDSARAFLPHCPLQSGVRTSTIPRSPTLYFHNNNNNNNNNNNRTSTIPRSPTLYFRPPDADERDC